MPSFSSFAPTESGPTEVWSPFVLTSEPPPKAILRTSGIVKFVRTPAILTNAADCLGYPVFNNAQISVVVLVPVSFKLGPTVRHSYPPTSTTRISLSSDISDVSTLASKAAPRALFVGPEEKHRTGYSAAVEALLKVPSLSVMYSLHLPSFCTAYRKPSITCLANRRKLAFNMLAFSRSRKPSLPTA